MKIPALSNLTYVIAILSIAVVIVATDGKIWLAFASTALLLTFFKIANYFDARKESPEKRRTSEHQDT